jgi:WS/DGAT/MGAT family acyltransferase
MPETQPSRTQLIKTAMTDSLAASRQDIKSLRSAITAPRKTAHKAGNIVDGLTSYSRSWLHGSQSSLNGSLGTSRSWRWACTPLSDIKKIREAHGGTLNDVVLAVISRGFRSLLAARGEAIEDHVVRTLVPVSVRKPGEHDITNNRVSAMVAELPIAIEDPLQRLAAVSQHMNGLKSHHQATAGEALVSLQDNTPAMLVALGGRMSAGVEQHMLQTICTNVPGPPNPLYATGKRMRRGYLYVPIAGTVRIGIAIFSYDGQLTFAVTGDADHIHDTHVLCQGIEAGIDELLQPG